MAGHEHGFAGVYHVDVALQRLSVCKRYVQSLISSSTKSSNRALSVFVQCKEVVLKACSFGENPLTITAIGVLFGKLKR
jgi:hypothetical protein